MIRLTSGFGDKNELGDRTLALWICPDENGYPGYYFSTYDINSNNKDYA